MQVTIRNAQGQDVGALEVLTRWEQRQVMPSLLHQAVVTDEANARIPWAHAKGRGEVRGGGKKPWKQKGTGRARHGSSRSPIWKGGGTTHGPLKERNYAKRMPQAMRITALAMALVTKVRDHELHLVQQLPDSAKTKNFVQFLQALGIKASVLVSPTADQRPRVRRASENIPGVRVKDASMITASDVLATKYLLVTPASWALIERRIARPQHRSSS